MVFSLLFSRRMRAMKTQTCRYSVYLAVTQSTQKWHWDIWSDVMPRWFICYCVIYYLLMFIHNLPGSQKKMVLFILLTFNICSLTVWEPNIFRLHVPYENWRVSWGENIEMVKTLYWREKMNGCYSFSPELPGYSVTFTIHRAKLTARDFRFCVQNIPETLRYQFLN